MVTLIGSTSTWFSASPSKPCQRSPGLQHPGGSLCPSAARHRIRLPDVRTTTSRHCCFTGGHGAAEGERLVDRLLTSARPAGCSIIAAATSQEAMMPVLRRGRGVHHERLVERAMSSCFVSAILHVDHGRLRQRGEQLVGGVGGERDGVLARVGCADEMAW